MNQPMKANNLMSTRIPRLASLVAWIAFFLALLMPLAVALLALARPYDAVPDQDLIWLSDALKLYRDQPPRYMDHPGAYWPLSTYFKINSLGVGGLGLLGIEPGEFISVDVASLIIRFNRIEQGLVCSFLGLCFWILGRLLLRKLWLACVIAAAYSLSYGVLFEAVQPRNESTSMAFLMIFAVCVLARWKCRISLSASRFLLSIIAIPSFFLALYCKVQVFPLAIALISLLLLGCSGLFQGKYNVARLRFLSAGEICRSISIFFIAFVGSLFAYLIRADEWLNNLTEYFYNTPSWKGIMYDDLRPAALIFWPLLFMCIAFICNCLAPFLQKKNAVSYLMWLAAVILSYLLLTGFLHENWSKHVFTAPLSLLWRSELYARDVDILRPFSQISIWPLDWAVTMSVGLFVSLLALAVVLKQSKPFVLLMFWSLALMVFAYNTTRFQPFYSIYFLPPLLLALAAIAELRPTPSAGGKPAQTLTSASHALAFLLIGGIGIQSLLGFGQLPQILAYTQYRDLLCMQRQGMDSMLANTSVGSCKDFEILKLD